MDPNYKRAAIKASETLEKYGINSSPVDSLRILSKFPNVRLFPFNIVSPDNGKAWDAMTCVRKKGDTFQYVVMYNREISPLMLNKALARELGHIVLEHDGNAPEEIWMEEANCFAYHFLCPLPTIKHICKINFRPDLKTISASFKAMLTFDSIDDMKAAIAEKQTQFNRCIGKPDVICSPDDVEIHSLNEKDTLGGWEEYSSVVVNGRAIGYCGK